MRRTTALSLPLAVVLALAGAAVTSAPAQARPCGLGNYCVTTYYSDSSWTTVVGQMVEECEGGGGSWGVRTIYKDFTERPC
ncbi:DUF6289 family protein [Nonomuraea montanisoli]|uniref:DUF6289 family protein n=1 Tax=Nonomuraea montanisoli TaxID=2741721 RepID=UPI001965C3A6|nr:DUF6289 family protein [Nonomuraea montanisoli]